MIDGSTPAGTKICCINRQGQYFLTPGKIYEVVSHPVGCYSPSYFWFYNDDSDLMYSEYEYGEFELVEEPL